MIAFSLHKVSIRQAPRGERFHPKPVCRVGSLTATKAPSMGLHDLLETVTVNVEKAESKPLKIVINTPFSQTPHELDTVEIVGVRVDLSNGCSGWGEIAVFPSENNPNLIGKAMLACDDLVSRPLMSLGSALDELGEALPGLEFASVRSGLEMALIDAAAKSIGLPLWRLFGGASDQIVTAITIPTVSPYEAAALACKYYQQGFKTLKIKLRNDVDADVEALQLITKNQPDCSIILDGDERFNAEEAIQLLDKLRETHIKPIIFEQPLHRDNWEGLRYITGQAKKKYGISIAADESCRSLADAKKIIFENCADMIVVKLAKNGVMGTIEIIKLAESSGMEIMVGGMTETRLATGFAGHLAAGYGCSKFADLESPLFLEKDPVFGGYEVSGGSVYNLSNSRGHAGFLHWDGEN